MDKYSLILEKDFYNLKLLKSNFGKMVITDVFKLIITIIKALEFAHDHNVSFTNHIDIDKIHILVIIS